jgi:cytochrome c oxidase cbb3-type subunit III
MVIAGARVVVLLLLFASWRSLAQAPSTPNGAQLFTANCAACHGLDGRGGEHAPNIATNAAVAQKSDTELAGIVRQGIPSGGMPGFSKLLDTPQILAVVSHLRILQKDEGPSKLTGDATRGRAVFLRAGGCNECHIFNGRGGFLGADLSGYGETHSASAIREWILDPDKNRDVRHSAVTVTTRQGRTYRGLIRNEDNFSLQLQTPDGAFHFFDKSELAQLTHEERSLMPNDYKTKLTSTQLDDLVAFLAKSKGGTSVAASGGDGDQ